MSDITNRDDLLLQFLRHALRHHQLRHVRLQMRRVVLIGERLDGAAIIIIEPSVIAQHGWVCPIVASIDELR